MKIVKTELPGVLLIEPRAFVDERGFFLETWNKERYLEAGFPDVQFVQDNQSRSRARVLRGLHFQRVRPQGKLVQVTRGAVFDVAVDIRTDSPHFGGWVGFQLSDSNHHQLWIPPGFAHGFVALSDVADVTYKCTERYLPEFDSGIRWDDADVGVEWPVTAPQLSPKDQSLPTLAQERTADRLPRVVE